MNAEPLPQVDDGAATAIVLDVLRKEQNLKTACVVALEQHRHLTPEHVVGLRLMKFAIQLKTQTQRDLLKALENKRGVDWTQVLAFLRKEMRRC